MRRLRILSAGFLPVFWLAASAHGSGLGPGEGAEVHCLRPAVVIHAVQGLETTARGVAGPWVSARHFTRRAASCPGSNPVPLSLSLCNPEPSGSGELQVRFDDTQAPPELAAGWQFHWRTALMPRAPSLVS